MCGLIERVGGAFSIYGVISQIIGSLGREVGGTSGLSGGFMLLEITTDEGHAIDG